MRILKKGYLYQTDGTLDETAQISVIEKVIDRTLQRTTEPIVEVCLNPAVRDGLTVKRVRDIPLTKDKAILPTAIYVVVEPAEGWGQEVK